MNEQKKAPAQIIPRIVKSIVPTTAIASGFLSPPSLGAPGDLDPTFGDMGRVVSALNFHGPAWSAQPLAADESFMAGGEYCDYYCGYYYASYADGFMAQISPSGALDLTVAAAPLAETEVFDFALQPDGKVVAVGRKFSASHSILTVFRLLPGGTLDPDFADAGVLHYETDTAAQSVVLDPSGAIVVAGSKASQLMVMRLLANGSLDNSFGDGGIYSGPPNDNTRIHILRTATGGYRVGATLSYLPHDIGVSYCAVVALTAAGVVDTTFGASGIAALPAQQAGASISCEAMAAQSDGSLLLGGQEAGHGFVSRVLAAGTLDPSFAAGAVPANMIEATALAVDAADSVLVAGASSPGVSGALILRLQATGMLDAAFGNGGVTWIDLPSDKTTFPTLNDMSVLPDGRILAAGGAWPTTSNRQQPLLVRLLGTGGTASPGVIGVTPYSLSVREEDKTAVVTVRRTGGAVGEVSVAYQTADYTGTEASPATSGADYTPVTGRLSWANGDRSDRQITVPIIADTGPVEEAERFIVTLGDAQGGAQIGTQDAVVEIAADGGPAGQFGFEESALQVNEALGQVEVVVDRKYYSTGAVTVAVTPVAGSATTADFAAAPIVLSWADGDSTPKTAAIPITKDNAAESPESFTLELANPSNGAVVGPHSRLVVTIDDAPPPSGGGGAFDGLTLLCLGCLRWLRSRLRGAGQGA